MGAVLGAGDPPDQLEVVNPAERLLPKVQIQWKTRSLLDLIAALTALALLLLGLML